MIQTVNDRLNSYCILFYILHGKTNSEVDAQKMNLHRPMPSLVGFITKKYSETLLCQ